MIGRHPAVITFVSQAIVACGHGRKTGVPMACTVSQPSCGVESREDWKVLVTRTEPGRVVQILNRVSATLTMLGGLRS